MKIHQSVMWHHRAKKGNLYARAETKMGQAFQDVISTIILLKKL